MSAAQQPYQLLPPLTEDEYAALRESIDTYGVLTPVVVDEDGNVLDGHHRVALAAELGVDYLIATLPGLSEDQKLEQALTLNMARRHLSVDQRRELVAELRARGLSLRFISESTGIPRATVHRDAAGVPGGTPGYVTGKDGKRYEPQRPTDPAQRWLRSWRDAGVTTPRLFAWGWELRGDLLASPIAGPLLRAMFADGLSDVAAHWNDTLLDSLTRIAAAHLLHGRAREDDHLPAPLHLLDAPGEFERTKLSRAAKYDRDWGATLRWCRLVEAEAGRFLIWCEDHEIKWREGLNLPDTVACADLGYFEAWIGAPYASLGLSHIPAGESRCAAGCRSPEYCSQILNDPDRQSRRLGVSWLDAERATIA